MPSATDRVIAGRYQLQSSVGRGAMGAVWLAQDTLLKRRVAVKEIDIPPSYAAADRGAMEARLLREARAAARLSHPGVVSVYDVIEHGDRPWIVMEYVDAPTLDDIVAGDGPLAPEAAARIGLELLAILDVAHRAGIVHRDVKPANVMVAQDGQVKLADFGIASIQDDPKITQTGLVLGSPAFMAPEQAQSGSTGPAADLWSLGATLYQAVEGVPPFDKGSALPTLTAVMSEEPRPMQRAGKLEPTISALLRKDPAERPSVAEARGMLQGIVAAVDTRAGTAVSGPHVAKTAVEEATRPAPERRRVADRPVPQTAPPAAARADRTWILWALLALAIAALVALPMILDGGDATSDRTRGSDEPAQDAAGDDAATDTGSGGSEDGSEDASEDGSAEAVPDWTTYEDPSTGYTLEYPSTWTPRVRRENRIDFADPTTATYLRVEWTDEPGDDVMARLEEIAAAFATNRSGYEEHQMTETEYLGYPAGLWEYSYEDGGANLHAYNLQFVIEDDWGFALNFQTREENWSDSQDLWEALKAGFEPPG